MRKFRRASVAQRLAVALTAIYGLLLHGLLMPPAHVHGPFGDITCVTDTSGKGSPADQHSSHHSLCCIVGCAACSVAYVGSLAGLVDFPIRETTRVGFAETYRLVAPPSREFCFAARGPPRKA